MLTVLAGTGRLVRLAIRLDRVRLAVWIVAMATLTFAVASAFQELYPTIDSRRLFADTLGRTPALVALTGRGFNLLSIGGLTSWRIGGFGATLVGLLGIFTVVRHTRAEEEAGRLEL
ncbi:MAG TPA: ABC transporter permease, partial [Actinomycetota bacterium]|nr:ABC transporter permease [Actinomycetota bacterium]